MNNKDISNGVEAILVQRILTVLSQNHFEQAIQSKSIGFALTFRITVIFMQIITNLTI